MARGDAGIVASGSGWAGVRSVGGVGSGRGGGDGGESGGLE